MGPKNSIYNRWWGPPCLSGGNSNIFSSWWFQIWFYFHPYLGKESHFDSYLSNGLKPPASFYFHPEPWERNPILTHIFSKGLKLPTRKHPRPLLYTSKPLYRRIQWFLGLYVCFFQMLKLIWSNSQLVRPAHFFFHKTKVSRDGISLVVPIHGSKKWVPFRVCIGDELLPSYVGICS